MPAAHHPKVFQSNTPFAIYARENGFPKLKEMPGAIAKLLSTRPHKVAPNSPALAELAKYMRVPLSELQAFAKAPPMGEKWVKKIAGQIAHGTLPKGEKIINKRYQRTKGQKHAQTPLGQLIQEKGWSVPRLAKEIGAPISTAFKLSAGNMPPNHPLVARVAEILDVPVGSVGAMMKNKPMNAGWLAQAEAKYGKAKPGKPGKAVVLSSIEHGPGANGSSSNGHHKRGPQNRLGSKRTPLPVRQAFRAFVATYNIAVMRGETHMPPIPVHDAQLVIESILTEMGVKTTVLLDTDFAEAFDPR